VRLIEATVDLRIDPSGQTDVSYLHSVLTHRLRSNFVTLGRDNQAVTDE